MLKHGCMSLSYKDEFAAGTLDDASLDAAADLALASLDPAADIHATADYRAHLARVLTERALTAAGA